MEPEDEYKKWLLLLLGLVKYDQAPEVLLHEFISSDHYTVTRTLQTFVIDQVCDKIYEFSALTITMDSVK